MALQILRRWKVIQSRRYRHSSTARMFWMRRIMHRSPAHTHLLLHLMRCSGVSTTRQMVQLTRSLHMLRGISQLNRAIPTRSIRIWQETVRFHVVGVQLVRRNLLRWLQLGFGLQRSVAYDFKAGSYHGLRETHVLGYYTLTRHFQIAGHAFFGPLYFCFGAVNE